MQRYSPAAEPIRKRIRLSFEVEVQYNPLPVDPQYPELARLQHLLLERPDLVHRLLANRGLRAVEELMEGMIRQGGLLGYDEQDLLAAAARSAEPEDLIPLVIAHSNGWEYEYTAPVTSDALEGEVVTLQAEDMEDGQPIALDPPEEPLLKRKARNYLIAETETTTLAAANIYHTERASNDWVREAHRTLDLLADDARILDQPLSRLEVTIYAANREDYDRVRAEVEWYSRTRLPGTQLSFGWFTLFSVDSPVLQRA